MQVKSSKANFDAYFKKIKELKNLYVKIGVPSDTGTYENGERIVDVAIIHEFGSDKMPQRSFIRKSIEKNQDEINKNIRQGYKRIVEKNSSVKKELGIMGVVAQDIIKNAFQTNGYGTWQDIKEETKEAKGSDEILIDTGKLVQSIKYWVVKK